MTQIHLKTPSNKPNTETDNAFNANIEGTPSINSPESVPDTVITPAEDVSVQSTPRANHNRQSSILSISSNATVDNAQIFKKTFDIILTSKRPRKMTALRI